MDTQKLRTPILKDSDLTDLAEHAECGLLIFTNDSKTTLLFANEFFFTILGYTRKEYIDKYDYYFSCCIYPEDSQKFKLVLARQFAMGNTFRFECRITKKNGTIGWILLIGQLHDEYTPSSYYCSCLDITELKESYNNLSRAKKELDIIANSLSGGILKVRLSDYKIIYANDGFYELGGYTREEYSEKYKDICIGIIHPDDKPNVLKKLKEALMLRKPLNVEYRIIHTSGQIRWSYLNGGIIEEIDGIPVFLSVIVNITTMKEYESELMLTQKNQQLLFDFSNEINWEYDMLSGVLSRSGKLETTYSTESEIKDFKTNIETSDIVYAEDIVKLKTFFEAAESGRSYLKITLRMKDSLGVYSWYGIQGVTLYDDNGKASRIIGKTSGIDSFQTNEAMQQNSTLDFCSEEDFSKQMDDILSNPSGNKQGVLYVAAVENPNNLKQSLGAFLYHTIITEISQRLRTSFPNCLKCSTLDGKFFVYSCGYISEENAKNIVQRITTGIYNLFADSPDLKASLQLKMGYCLQDAGIPDSEEFCRKSLDFIPAEAPGQVNTVGFTDDLTAASARELNFLFEAINLLDKFDENPGVIKLTLASICTFFDAEQVCIIEDSLDRQNCALTYDWFIPGSSRHQSDLYTLPYESMKNYRNLFNDQGLFVCSDILEVKGISSDIYTELTKLGVQALLECALYDNGTYFGFLTVNFYKIPQTFSVYEKECLKIIARMLSSILSKQRHQQLMSHTKNYDPVTGLLRFPQFVELANHDLGMERKESLALIYTDIDGFNSFNTKYGFTMGNNLLKFLCNSILHHLKPDELCTRLQGDHFVSLIKFNTMDELNIRLSEFHEVRMFRQTDQSVCHSFSLSSGVYLVRDGELSITDLLDKANFARKSVKQMSGASKYTIYSKAMHKWNEKEKELLLSLENAFYNHEFVPYYQPKYHLFTEELHSLEALARWKKAGSLRVLYPPEFLPILEQNKKVIDLDFCMIEEVCRTLHLWMAQKKKLIPVSVNISGAHLGTQDFDTRLMAMVERYQVPPQYLILEFTEKLFMEEPEPLLSLTSKLSKQGFPITIDDFGREYSSLNLFRRFPIDAIKFDTGFFYGKKTEYRDKIILKKIIETAKELGIKVLTENVETSLQANLLKELGCEVVQGFLYHKPMPLEDIEKYVLT